MSSSSEKKTTKKSSPTPESTPIPSLPDDLLLSCFARVSRLYYPTLSLASKRFRSLLASPELYQTRSSLDRKESCLYVCLRFNPDPNPRWFALCRKPIQTLTSNNKESSGYVLAKLPIAHSPPACSQSLVTVGSNIYKIGAFSDIYRSTSVSILDCRYHTWRKAPSMHVARNYPAATVLDGNIYVVGGCDYNNCNSSNWMEVFDPKTQTWELVSSRGKEKCGCKIYKNAAIDGKLYTFGNYKGLSYEPKESRWETADWERVLSWAWFCYCVIDNVIYTYDCLKFKWYDTKKRCLTILKGLEGMPKIVSFYVKLADYGGKLAVLWDNRVDGSEYKVKICCAVIALEKRNNNDEEIWGKVEWCDAVLTVPRLHGFVHALAVTF